jgi:hypothetical protein
MITDTYPFMASYNKTQYLFQSQGKQGKILKVVVFTHIGGDLWNLGFGDAYDGKIDDLVVSNNQDITKVISTVAQIAYAFFTDFPKRSIEIKPIDERRRSLYNDVFRRHFIHIEPSFHVIGSINGIEELYHPDNFYDSFKLKLKF